MSQIRVDIWSRCVQEMFVLDFPKNYQEDASLDFAGTTTSGAAENGRVEARDERQDQIGPIQVG